MDILPLEIQHNILYYVDPNSLKTIVDSELEWIYVINSMNMKAYVEKWLGLNNKHKYIYNVTKSDDLCYATQKYWFMTLSFNKNTLCKLNDILKLKNTKHLCLDISWSNITDVSMLSGLHTLNLSWCENITDVSMLVGLHTLHLSNCTQITDVSMLGSLHTLNLTCCTQITDVSMLGGLHTLILHSCDGITDVSMLGGLNTLDLKWCTQIADISMLNNIKHLTI